jgi:hypothetical protein
MPYFPLIFLASQGGREVAKGLHGRAVLLCFRFPGAKQRANPNPHFLLMNYFLGCEDLHSEADFLCEGSGEGPGACTWIPATRVYSLVGDLAHGMARTPA